MQKKREQIIDQLSQEIIKVISETNGISLSDTIELLTHSQDIKKNILLEKSLHEFTKLLSGYQINEVDIETLLAHPFSDAFFNFFKNFPIPYHEEHIHLTGSLTAEFIYPRLKPLLEGPNKEIYEKKIKEVYGEDSIPINSVDDVDKLIRLEEGEQFSTYLRILYLPKLILTDKKVHEEAAYFMAKDLYEKYNVGNIRLKFTLSRSTSMESEQIPGLEGITEEDVVSGLYDGFKKYQKENEIFDFVLSPCFRKELNFYDKQNFNSKKEHFEHQVDQILKIIEKRPELKNYITEIDTVGDEKELYRKSHFLELKSGFRKLQYNGFKIRSHHGETWKNLRKGVQSVDNAMNIWHIDTLEHGLSLGINPNYYFHSLFQRLFEENQNGHPIKENSSEYHEIIDMEWHDSEVKEKLLKGVPLTDTETISFLKTKFHTAREIEHYQHDILNRMIHKNISLVALPSSNLKLTGCFPDYKDHPFSWWEKKGVKLGVGTDNYITLSTNYIKEMLILLYSDPANLKITKLLMITTKEKRRPFLSHFLWEMRKEFCTKS
jgi:adenosine deaminase